MIKVGEVLIFTYIKDNPYPLIYLITDIKNKSMDDDSIVTLTRIDIKDHDHSQISRSLSYLNENFLLTTEFRVWYRLDEI